MTEGASTHTTTKDHVPPPSSGGSASKGLGGLRGLFGIAALIAVLAFVPHGVDPYTLVVLTQILVYGGVAVSLQMLWGRGGQLSFGHAAFFGIGAFTYAILSLKTDVGGISALLLAGVVPAVAALVLGSFLFYGGVRGAYFSVVTLAFAIVVNQLAISWTSFTGGNSGLIGVPGVTFEHVGLSVDLATPEGCFYLALGVLAFTLVVAFLVDVSRLGLIFRTIRENEMRTTFCGFNTPAYLTGLLALSVFLAGLAGGTFAAVSNYAAPDMTGTLLSVEMLTWVAVGGRNYVAGALVGVFALRWLNIQLSTVLPTSWPLLVGVFFVLVVMVLPDGLVGSVMNAVRRLRSPKREQREVAS